MVPNDGSSSDNDDGESLGGSAGFVLLDSASAVLFLICEPLREIFLAAIFV